MAALVEEDLVEVVGVVMMEEAGRAMDRMGIMEVKVTVKNMHTRVLCFEVKMPLNDY